MGLHIWLYQGEFVLVGEAKITATKELRGGRKAVKLTIEAPKEIKITKSESGRLEASTDLLDLSRKPSKRAK